MCKAYYHCRSIWETIQLYSRLNKFNGEAFYLLYVVQLGRDRTMYVILIHDEIAKVIKQNKLGRDVIM